MKNREDMEARLAELRAERGRMVGEIEKARTEARDALIAGWKPPAGAAALIERAKALDDAVREMEQRLRGAADSADRSARRRRAEAALEATSKRAKLAGAVDEALASLAAAWAAYVGALRGDVGAVSGANGDLTAVERALTNNRAAEPLVKALISAGGVGLARSLGVDTPIRERHAAALADAEERVAESLRVELLCVRAESPQPNVSREARAELGELEESLG